MTKTKNDTDMDEQPSENKSKKQEVLEDETQSDRQKELYVARLILEKIEARLSTDRFRTYDTDDAYLKFVRVYDQHLMTINTIRRDIELEDLQKQIDELKEQQEQRGS